MPMDLSLLGLEMIQDYLLNRKQRTKIGSSYRTWENIYLLFHKTILGPLLFNTFLCGLFLEHEDSCFTNYVDNTTPYMTANNTAKVIEYLTIITKKPLIWFANNQVRVNSNKCHLLLSTQEDANIQITNTTRKCFKVKKKQNYWE